MMIQSIYIVEKFYFGILKYKNFMIRYMYSSLNMKNKCK